MAVGVVKYRRGSDGSTEDTTRLPSSNIWYDMEKDSDATEHGVYFFDDFLNFHDIAAAETENYNGYGALVATGCSIASLATEEYGVIRLTHDGTNDDEVGLATNLDVAGMVEIVKDSKNKVAFEARIRMSDVTNAHALFVGLAGEGSMTTDAMLADGCAAVTNKDMAGFRIADDDNDGLDAVCNDGSAETVVQNAGDLAVANTWVKLGVKFDGDNRVDFYVNGTSVGNCAANATNFPDAAELVGCLITKDGGATARTYDVDWWAIGQTVKHA